MTKTKMMKAMIAPWIVLAALTGAALAQSDSQPPVAAAASPAAPAGGEAAGDARKACTAAMNADPTFAAEISKVADERAAAKRDADTVAAHVAANLHIQKDERHVIYAYAAMWIVAAGFVLFLWRRQQALTAEIAQLRRELDAAADGKPGDARS
jgi:hypothetical protein